MSLTPSRCNRRPGDGAGRLVVCNICVTVYRIIKDPKFLIPGAPREREIVLVAPFWRGQHDKEPRFHSRLFVCEIEKSTAP